MENCETPSHSKSFNIGIKLRDGESQVMSFTHSFSNTCNRICIV